MTLSEWSAAIDRLPVVDLPRPETGGVEPYVKRRDVEILWTQLDPPPTLELIDAIQAAIKSQQDGHLGPYAVIEEIANAVNHYVNGVD